MKAVYIFLSFVAFCAPLTNGVQITVDTSKAPQLQAFGQKVKATLEDQYPKVVQTLNSPNFRPIQKFRIFFDPNYDGVAEAGGDLIRGSVQYYSNHQDDLGSMVHEMAHLIQAYQKCDGWITEGIADWVRYYKYEPNRQPGKPGPNDQYQSGYGVAAYFLNYISNQYGEPYFIYYLNKDCREGTYDVSIFKRLTGRTPDEHWQEMMDSK